MGQRYLFVCPKCNYQVESTGGPDCGYMADVNAFICQRCKNVTDALIGSRMQGYQETIEDVRCTECNSPDLVEWDRRRRPCPKCGRKMFKDKNVRILWD